MSKTAPVKFHSPKSLRYFLLRWLAGVLQPYLYSTPFFYGNDPTDLIVGDNVSFSNTAINTRSGKIIIGNNVIFGHSTMLLTGYHEVDHIASAKPTVVDAGRDIVIEDNVWVASGAIVIGPARIGRNSVIGAGAVVVGDIPEDVLAAGNPARVIRELGQKSRRKRESI